MCDFIFWLELVDFLHWNVMQGVFGSGHASWPAFCQSSVETGVLLQDMRAVFISWSPQRLVMFQDCPASCSEPPLASWRQLASARGADWLVRLYLYTGAKGWRTVKKNKMVCHLNSVQQVLSKWPANKFILKSTLEAAIPQTFKWRVLWLEALWSCSILLAPSGSLSCLLLQLLE